MRRLTTFLAFLVIIATCHLGAQSDGDRAASTKSFNEGVQALLDGKPKKGLRNFMAAVKADDSFLPARRFRGLSYELLDNYPAAANDYEQVLAADSTFSRLLYYQLGMVYYRMSRPSLALHYLTRFQELQKKDVGEFGRNGEEELEQEARILEQLDNQLKAVSITQDSSQFINITKLFNIGFPINTQQNDYFPFFANNPNTFLFTRQGAGQDEDLLIARRKGPEDDWVSSRFASINTLQPEGMCSLVRDGQRIYFTSCKGDEVVVAKGFRRRGNCDLYAGWLVNGKIKDVVPLPDYINGPDSWETQAAISCDEQQLFFVSDRQPSFGQTDIFVCHRQANGSWGEPQNLGEGVNTPMAEEAPFLSNDGQTLYFSSTGHRTLGDEDIFASWWDNSQGRFTRALNLGPPVNGPHRELGFHLSADGKTGYVASDRPGGWGKLDIYGFKLSDKLSSRPVTYLSGYLRDSISGEPVANQRVIVGNGKFYETNYEGRFFVCANAREPLAVRVDAAGYLPYRRRFAVPEWDNHEPYRINILLASEEPPVVVEEPTVEPADTIRRVARVKSLPYIVRFNFDDASLTAYAIEGLTKFIESVKGKNIVKITLTGYTDNIGDQEFNVRLSQKRARAVGVHLKAAGVSADEVNIVGAGELPGATQRALNRKVEVVVVYRELVEIR